MAAGRECDGVPGARAVRSLLGPALAAGEWTDFWLYITAPIAGAAALAGGRRSIVDRRGRSGVAAVAATFVLICLPEEVQARALRDATAGGRYPVVDARASVTERRQSENGPLPIGASSHEVGSLRHASGIG